MAYIHTTQTQQLAIKLSDYKTPSIFKVESHSIYMVPEGDSDLSGTPKIHGNMHMHGSQIKSETREVELQYVQH